MKLSWSNSSPGCLAALLLHTLPSFAIWPFPPKRFSGNALLNAGSMGVGPESSIIAFGDFNGDQFLDLLALDSDRQSLHMYLWDHEAYTFKSSGGFRHPQRVFNVIPGDFTQDGKLDLLVYGQSSTSSVLSVQLYVANPEGGFDFKSISADPAIYAQPIPMDMNGDLKIDLLGTTSSAPSSTFKVWQNVWNASSTRSNVFNVVDPDFKGQHCRLANPHSNAAVDLDGDCLADVFLVCEDPSTGGKYFQIWVNKKDNGFELAQTRSLPAGTQAISFADIDRDGTLDMMFATCTSVSSSTGIGTTCFINIAFNKQLPLCAASTSPNIVNGKRVCRLPEQLCVADPNFQFDLNDGAGNDAFVRIPLSDLFPPTESSPAPPGLLVVDSSQSPAIPIPIKLGDVNQDGFPDLLMIVATGSSSKRQRTPYLIESIPCGKGVPGCGSNGSGRRGWQVVRKDADALISVQDARSAAFLDMDEDGSLDIMVQRTGEQKQGNILFVQNNFYYDAFFLKAIVLNGACSTGVCPASNGSDKHHPYGVSYSGASYKYTVLDTTGRRSAAQVGQMPQAAYQALLTPYVYFGLGRTNNYIENLFGVIPNSKVVIIPPIEGDTWRRELYLRPGEWIPWVTITVIAALIILAIIVLVLHLNEKREDELERRRASHHINFDAL
ncbi:integrin alpha N-terminal domain-containing protein [Epithele typhae]|uniref:integrin alpha N-terminal domain-containing protein n=1 Tax=Epithele typhae TaxID=378194 RepID=UPI002007FA2A|nr:integrin alpha N-terminal domain-containing protein [Epithele typhae]KAH9918403.1 integrin alpha N-terminal domain-containing protein [Epithele typhae]